ncbi:facilitated trehalose transporter Tret1-like [Diabrotica virgifera virgifera]|uniref:Facilitated trehalose transporter Tret1-like n=1 Tax=Diabrotica virgifera virgifera TaxID=50390 RepID=A0A6P7H2T0_DIAVI|nr:facilitated trehalose transporter Tret1-like [Diabrotica virgifera virgifera]
MTTLSWSTVVLPKLSNFDTSPIGRRVGMEEESWISSIINISAIFSVFIFGYLADKTGRKCTLLIAGMPYLLSNIILAYASSVYLYYIARFLMGFTIGTLSLLPVYISEISHKNHRNVIGPLIGCAGCFGALFPNLLGPFVSMKTFSLVQAALAAIYLVFFAILGEEGPQFYIIRNREFQARAVLERLRGSYDDIDETFAEIKNGYNEEKQGTLRDILTSRSLKKAFIMCTVLLILQQFCGIVAISFYGQTLFEKSNIQLSPELSVILLGTIQLMASFITPFVSTKFGKKPLLIISGILTALSQIVLAIDSYFDGFVRFAPAFRYLPLLCLIVFIIGYSLGLGPQPWMIVGEVFPTRVKTVISSVEGFTIFVCAFLLTKYYMHIVRMIGMQGYFLFSAIVCIIATIFSKFYVIETKDKSLEEIQRDLSR